MVAASSKHSHRPELATLKNAPADDKLRARWRVLDTLSAGVKDLPSTDTCITHLRLLAAFHRLRQSITSNNGLYGIFDKPSVTASELRWTIFVANAVQRFGTWLQLLFPDGFKPLLTRSTACEASHFDDLMSSTEPLHWSQENLPPLDVLMVLHSYTLNPHDFLHDCLRCGGIALWKAGFPWQNVKSAVNQMTLAYEPPERTVSIFECQTGLPWSPPDQKATALVICPSCSHQTSIGLSKLYSEESSQMEKGNTLMPFKTSCPNCGQEISQDLLSQNRLRTDLETLLRDDVVMPGTLLSRDGLIPSKKSKPLIPSNTALLNKVLYEGVAEEMIDKMKCKQHLTPCAMNDDIISSITEGSLKEHLGGIEETEDTFRAMMTGARRMRSTYERNFSPFALDLVGAVVRQGVFIEKMHYFDWLHSPAVEHTIACSLERYAGFFAVMKHNPSRTAVPTFDVDLVWHTQQLTPVQYYKFSLENCNQVFIDHDDKIAEDVLNNSFDWTCDKYQELTNTHYDKCLCWCCAALERDSISCESMRPEKSLSSRVKGLMRSLKKGEAPTEAEGFVIDIQTRKFERDYLKEYEKLKTGSETSMSKKTFFDSYIWHYPKYAPHPEEVGAA